MRCSRWLVVVSLLALAVSCRQARPEAGLPADAFSGLLPKLVSNERGLWFLVTAPDEERKPFVVIGEGEEREVFYAVPTGDRTIQLMPVTPFAYASLDAQRGNRIDATWVDDPADAGETLPDTIGWVTGSRAERVEWAGSTPVDGTAITLVSGSAPPGLDVSKWIVGTARIAGGKLADVRAVPDAQPPFVAIPDGVVALDDLTIAANGVQVPERAGLSTRAVDWGTLEDTSRFTLQPRGLKEGVDAVATARGYRVDVLLTAPVVESGLPLSVSFDTVTVSRDQLAGVLLALRNLTAGRKLAAALGMLAASPASGENTVSGRMRALELIAAAGYVDWMRAELVSNVPGLGADGAYYLARGHFLAGDTERAIQFAARSRDLFFDWPQPAGRLGEARSISLIAHVGSRAGDWSTAFSDAIQAAEYFEDGRDSMRAAEEELAAASYALNAREPKRALSAANLARSRFFHGNSPYHSGFAEIALSEVYRRAGQSEDAAKMARFAVLRFEELGHPAARNRARIAESRVRGELAKAGATRELEVALDQARERRDIVGAFDAASSLVVLGGVSGDAAPAFGKVILSGMSRVQDPSVRDRGNQAIALLCGQGLSESMQAYNEADDADRARAVAACNRGTTLPSDTLAASLIAQGWTALASNDLAAARATAKRLLELTTGEMRVEAPRRAADAIFFAAIVEHRADEGSGKERAQEGIELLGSAVDPTRLSQALSDYASQYVARGETWLASSLLRGAMAAASDQGQGDLRRSAALRRVMILHSAGDLDGALGAVRDARPVLQTAASSAAGPLSRLHLFEEDALIRLGRDADASIAGGKVTKALADADTTEQLRTNVLGASLAAQRGDISAARERLKRARSHEAALDKGLDGGRNELLLAEARVVAGDVAVLAGDLRSAADAYGDAVSRAAGLDTPDAMGVRLRALIGFGETASTDNEVEQTIRQVESLRARAASSMPSSRPAATEALVRLELSFGRPGRAKTLIDAAALEGAAVATTPLESDCLTGRTAVLSGGSTTGELDACIRAAAGSARIDAELLRAMMGEGNRMATAQAAQRLLLANKDASPRVRARLELVREMATKGEGPSANADRRTKRALERAIASGDDSSVVNAVSDRVAILLPAAPDEAAALLKAHSRAFFDASAESPGTLASLRTRVAVASFQPVEAFNVAARSISETESWNAGDETRLRLAAARNSIVLGMWQHARSELGAAAIASANDRKLRAEVDAMAAKFALPIPK